MTANQKSIRRTAAAPILTGGAGKAMTILALLAMLVALPCGVACAEGFPGQGDRVLYAEALPHYNLGNKYLAKEWYEKAVEKYLDAINIYEYDADVYTNLAVAYRKLGNIAGAENASRKAVELNDTDWTAWSNLANLLMAQDKFSESYKCFQRAMKCSGIPAEEKTFIESNIDGMKKIMKARGLTLEGQSLTPIAVTKAAPTKTATKKGTPRVTLAVQQARLDSVEKRKPAASSKQLAGARESEIDTKAYDQWLGDK